MQDETSTVFIVDDNVKNLQVAANFLRLGNYKVLVSDKGKEALVNIEKYQPDVVLLDIMMPEMDGFEVCQKLKENEKTKEIPIIFLTAKTETDSLTKAFKLGGVDYITKPFNSDELMVRIKTHITLKKQNAALKDLNITKDKLFRVLGHDLRGNLASILSMSELLIDDQYEMDEAQTKEFHRYINNQANNLNIILGNVLDWSKSKDNKLIFDPRKINLKKVAAANVKLLTENAHLKELKLYSKVEDDVLVFGDENMLNTILRNLIFNAIKFTNSNGEIFIDFEERDKMIWVKVTDTGIGIREEKQSTIFSGNPNVSTEGTSKETGTGLGLILCKEFAEKNGGEIWLESAPGEGTTILFSIPVFEETSI